MSSVIHSEPTDTILPPEIPDASAWYGSDLKASTDWIERLSEAEIAEVESADFQETDQNQRGINDRSFA